MFSLDRKTRYTIQSADLYLKFTCVVQVEASTARIFSNPPGEFGSLVNERVSDSSWTDEGELGLPPLLLRLFPLWKVNATFWPELVQFSPLKRFELFPFP